MKPTETETTISGVVNDISGNPVPGAYLNFGARLQFLSSGSTIDQPPAQPHELGFTLNLAQRQHTTFVLQDYTQSPIRTLVDDTLEAGSHLFFWDLLDNQQRFCFTDCYFIVQLNGDSVIKTGKAMIVTAQHLQPNPSPYVQTDVDGRFSIPLSRVPSNEVFPVTDVTGQVVDSMRLDDTQILYAFDSTFFGIDTIPIDHPSSITITLSSPK